MGKKYIIEMKENERLYKAKLDAFNGPVIQEIAGAPYTEPDLEQIRKEAYEQGYDDAKSGYDNGFENGMIVAWEAARKIVLDKNKGGIILSELQQIFHKGLPSEIIEVFSAPEAIEKIRQYEQRQEEQDGLRQNIQTIVDQCGYTLDEIAEVLAKMKEASDG